MNGIGEDGICNSSNNNKNILHKSRIYGVSGRREENENQDLGNILQTKQPCMKPHEVPPSQGAMREAMSLSAGNESFLICSYSHGVILPQNNVLDFQCSLVELSLGLRFGSLRRGRLSSATRL